MKLYRILALVRRDLLVMRRSKFMLVEYLYYPIVTVFTWGFFLLYAQEFAVQAGLIVFVANILMSLMSTTQSAINVTMMDDSWSGSFLGLMLSGISEGEYLVARIISSLLVSVGLLVLLYSVAFFGFGVSLIGVHFMPILLITLLAMVASIGFAIILGGIILALGKEFGFLAWSALVLFILLSAPLFPVAVFPPGFREISTVMPFTGAFEALRELVGTGVVNYGLILQQAVVSLAYIVAGLPIYFAIFRFARKTGKLIRMSW